MRVVEGWGTDGRSRAPARPATEPCSPCGAGAAPAAATGPLAAGGASPAALPRLYWVPAVGLLPGTDRYRRDAGLEGIPLPPTADIATATLAGAGEAQAPGQVRVEQPAVPPVAALGGMHLTGQ